MFWFGISHRDCAGPSWAVRQEGSPGQVLCRVQAVLHLCLLGLALCLCRLVWFCVSADWFSLYHWDLTMPSNVGTKLVLFLLDGKPNKQAQNSKKTHVNKKGLMPVAVQIVKGGVSW